MNNHGIFKMGVIASVSPTLPIKLIHVPTIGQSQNLGVGSTVDLGTPTDVNVLMLGTYTALPLGLTQGEINTFDFETLEENNVEGSPVETLGVALGTDLLNKINLLDDGLYDYRILITNHSLPSTGINDLDKGGSSGAFESMMFAIERAAALANTSGWVYEFHPIVNHGGTVASGYGADIISIINNMRTDGSVLPNVTQSSTDIHVVSNQIRQRDVALPEASSDAIAAHDSLSKVWTSHGRNWVEKTDGVHLKSNGTRHEAALYANSMFEVIFNDTWENLYLGTPTLETGQELHFPISGHKRDFARQRWIDDGESGDMATYLAADLATQSYGGQLTLTGNGGISLYDFTGATSITIGTVSVDDTDPDNPILVVPMTNLQGGERSIDIEVNHDDNLNVYADFNGATALGYLRCDTLPRYASIHDDTNTSLPYETESFNFRALDVILVDNNITPTTDYNTWAGATEVDQEIPTSEAVDVTVWAVGYLTEQEAIDSLLTSGTDLKTDAEGSGGEFRIKFDNTGATGSLVTGTMSSGITEETVYYYALRSEATSGGAEQESWYRTVFTKWIYKEQLYQNTYNDWGMGYSITLSNKTWKLSQKTPSTIFETMVSLHGNGEKPTNNEIDGVAATGYAVDFRAGTGIANINFGSDIKSAPYDDVIVIATQFRAAIPERDTTQIVIDHMVNRLLVPYKKGLQGLHLFGLSGGGGMPFIQAMWYPETVASIFAAAPWIAYEDDSDFVITYTKDLWEEVDHFYWVPIHLHTNSDDGFYSHSSNMIDYMLATASITPPITPDLTENDGTGHNGWEKVANETSSWTFSHNNVNATGSIANWREWVASHGPSFSYYNNIDNVVLVAESNLEVEFKDKAQATIDRDEAGIDFLSAGERANFQSRIDEIDNVIIAEGLVLTAETTTDTGDYGTAETAVFGLTTSTNRTNLETRLNIILLEEVPTDTLVTTAEGTELWVDIAPAQTAVDGLSPLGNISGITESSMSSIITTLQTRIDQIGAPEIFIVNMRPKTAASASNGHPGDGYGTYSVGGDTYNDTDGYFYWDSPHITNMRSTVGVELGYVLNINNEHFNSSRTESGGTAGDYFEDLAAWSFLEVVGNAPEVEITGLNSEDTYKIEILSSWNPSGVNRDGYVDINLGGTLSITGGATNDNVEEDITVFSGVGMTGGIGSTAGIISMVFTKQAGANSFPLNVVKFTKDQEIMLFNFRPSDAATASGSGTYSVGGEYYNETIDGTTASDSGSAVINNQGTSLGYTFSITDNFSSGETASGSVVGEYFESVVALSLLQSGTGSGGGFEIVGMATASTYKIELMCSWPDASNKEMDIIVNGADIGASQSYRITDINDNRDNLGEDMVVFQGVPIYSGGIQVQCTLPGGVSSNALNAVKITRE